MKPTPTDELGFPVQADPWEGPEPDREPWPRSLKLSVAAFVLTVAAAGLNVYTATLYRRAAGAWQRRALDAEREAMWLRAIRRPMGGAWVAPMPGKRDDPDVGACIFELGGGADGT